MTIKRGEVYYADLNPVVGSEQGGVRPVVVLQNDVGNKYSPTVIAAATTSRLYKAKLPTHIEIAKENSPLPKNPRSADFFKLLKDHDVVYCINRVAPPPPFHKRAVRKLSRVLKSIFKFGR